MKTALSNGPIKGREGKMKKIFGVIGGIFIAGSVLFLSPAVSSAQTGGTSLKSSIPEQAVEEILGPGVTAASHEVTGIVMSTTSRSLTLEISKEGTSSSEMLLPLDESTVFKGKTTAKDFLYGDNVKVLYEQKSKLDEAGESAVFSTITKSVTLLNAASAEFTKP